MNLKFIKTCLIILIFTGLYSCTSQKNFVYLQDKGNYNPTVILKNDTFKYRIRKQDILYIKTVSIDQTSSFTLNTTSQAGDLAGTQNAYLNGYTVNDSGKIEMPLIGKIYVEGMTVDQIQRIVQKKVDYYLKNSLVIVKLLNFNITVLGEVNNPGNFSVSSSHVNLLEAIGLAGDLTVNANRKQVMLIRQNTSDKVINIDLTDRSLLQSDYYNLMPNDIIYVKPNRSKYYGTNPFPFSTVLTAITTLILVISYLHK